jgi:hypothetical protein
LWKIYCCLWLRGYCLWGLLNTFGFKGWHVSCVHGLNSHPRRCLLKIFCQVWLKEPWLHMCSLHWLIVYQPFAHLTCGCQKEYTMFLLLLILSQVTRRHVTIGLFEVTNTSDVIIAPKLQELLNKFFLTKKILLTLKIKGPTCKPMQMPWFLLWVMYYFGLIGTIWWLMFGAHTFKCIIICYCIWKNHLKFTLYIYKGHSICHLKMYYMAQKFNKGRQTWDKAWI